MCVWSKHKKIFLFLLNTLNGITVINRDGFVAYFVRQSVSDRLYWMVFFVCLYWLIPDESTPKQQHDGTNLGFFQWIKIQAERALQLKYLYFFFWYENVFKDIEFNRINVYEDFFQCENSVTLLHLIIRPRISN